jgi:hypothetical protein
MDSLGHTKKAMLAALDKSLGIVKTACQEVGIARQTHYNWMEADPDYKQAVESIGEGVIDFVESKLHTLIVNGDTAATIFYMKTKAKKRGYVERQELTGADNQPIITISSNL